MSGTASEQGRSFCVVPAAGHSRRMGRPKLLLPVHSQTVVRRLLDALAHPEIVRTYVVVRQDDRPLAEEVERAGGRVVLPAVDPPDMKASVIAGLETIANEHAPRDDEGWLLVPADHPVLDHAVVGRLLDEWKRSDADVLLPTFEGRRGHPTILRWSLADRIRQLPPDRGVNAVVRAPTTRVRECPTSDPSILFDLDTPEDYARLLADRTERGPGG